MKNGSYFGYKTVSLMIHVKLSTVNKHPFDYVQHRQKINAFFVARHFDDSKDLII